MRADITVAISPTCSPSCFVTDLHLQQGRVASVSDLTHLSFQASEQILAPLDRECPNFLTDSSHKLFDISRFPAISVYHIFQSSKELLNRPDLRHGRGLLSFGTKGIF